MKNSFAADVSDNIAKSEHKKPPMSAFTMTQKSDFDIFSSLGKIPTPVMKESPKNEGPQLANVYSRMKIDRNLNLAPHHLKEMVRVKV